MDPIADFLIKMKNAGLVGKEAISVPHSAIKESIATILEKTGFIKAVNKKKRNNQKLLEIELSYEGKTPRISEVKRVSKPSRRVYQSFKDLRPFKNGLGITVLSTPKGILTDSEARKEKSGGEVLFKIW